MPRCGPNKARYGPLKQHSQPTPREKKTAPTLGRKRRFAAETELLAAVEADEEACGLLATATTPSSRLDFFEYVLANITLPKGLPWPKNPSTFLDDFTSWAGQLGSLRNIPVKRLPIALSYRLQEKNLLRWSKQNFIETARLNWKAVDKETFLGKLDVLKVKALPEGEIYPPIDEYIAETPAIYIKNRKFIYSDDLHDNRDHRRSIHKLEVGSLRKDIPFDQSVVIYDEDDGSLIGMVVRNVCKNADAVAFVDNAVNHVIETRKTCRKGDAGSLPQVGLSAGSRSALCLDWVKNLKSKKAPADEQERANKQASSAFALFWNLTRSVAPQDVLSDFDQYLKDLGIRRMDGAGSMPHNLATGRGNYSVSIPGHDFTFYGAELAPPTGVCGWNYARYTHKEHQPHKFAVSWTTSRQMVPNVGHVENGGNFFIASHGIRIQQAANTLIIWRPTLWHATSLPLQHPRVPVTPFSQSGLAFVTSPRLPTAWKNYREKKIAKEAAENMLLEHEPPAATVLGPPPPPPSNGSPDLAVDQRLISGLGDLVADQPSKPGRRPQRSKRLPQKYKDYVKARFTLSFFLL